jgi:uncharacterized protein YbjQ (UPF0145 family)
MIITTTPTIPGKQIASIIDMVRGNTVRARWFGRDIVAGLKTIVGGEVKSYTEMIDKARDEAIGRMIQEAERLHADAIVNVRLATSDVLQGSAEILAYGTAVKLK